MQIWDWLVLLLPLALVTAIALRTQRYTRSVADFMAASRVAGRYLVATATGEASYGATNVIASFEMFFASGFIFSWWLNFNNIVWLFILLSGFIIYRYRESRVMTLAQFFEIRYSKPFRIFAGVLAFASGLLSYGIYPQIGAKFFVYFCGLPVSFAVHGHQVPTFLPVMVLLITPSVLMTTLGGQLTLMVIDCVEGIISLVFYFCIAATLFWIFSWADVSAALLSAPKGLSMVNPFDGEGHKDFGFWYVMIAIFVNAYGWQSSQVGHGFRSAAINAHEQKMGAILGPWRNEVRTLMLTILCICAFTFMHHPHFAAAAAPAHALVEGTTNLAERKMLQTPIALSMMLPPVVKGMFAAIMLFALISTDCTMMHSWGTILVQDIVVPIWNKPLKMRTHVNLLRASVVGVAIFAVLFSALVPQTTFINMFLAIMGAIFAGAGACIIGGFYWKRGTAAGAWGAMISGAVVSVVGLLVTRNWPAIVYPWLAAHAPALLAKTDVILRGISSTIPNINWRIAPDEFFLNGQWIWCFATLAAIACYVGFSLLSRRQLFDLDRMLYRGAYALPSEQSKAPVTGRQKFSLKALIGVTPQFTAADKAISYSLLFYRLGWFLIVLTVLLWNLPAAGRWSDTTWITFWHVTFIWMPFAIAAIMVVWFTIGGIKDIRDLFSRLECVQVNPDDDGTVGLGNATPIEQVPVSVDAGQVEPTSSR